MDCSTLKKVCCRKKYYKQREILIRGLHLLVLLGVEMTLGSRLREVENWEKIYQTLRFHEPHLRGVAMKINMMMEARQRIL